MAEGYEPDYRVLFNKTLSALAQIDKALGLPEDGQNTLLNTLNAIHYYKALAHGDMGFGLPDFLKTKPPKAENQHWTDKTGKNYGADIATLIELIDSGEL